jgi:hypothetical protein
MHFTVLRCGHDPAGRPACLTGGRHSTPMVDAVMRFAPICVRFDADLNRSINGLSNNFAVLM